MSLDTMTDAEIVALIKTFEPHDEGGQPMIALHFDLWRRVLALAKVPTDDDVERAAITIAAMQTGDSFEDAKIEFYESLEEGDRLDWRATVRAVIAAL
jgi:hypothetical protein